MHSVLPQEEYSVGSIPFRTIFCSDFHLLWKERRLVWNVMLAKQSYDFFATEDSGAARSSIRYVRGIVYTINIRVHQVVCILRIPVWDAQ